MTEPIILPMQRSDEDQMLAKAEAAFSRAPMRVPGAAAIIPIGQEFREPGAVDPRLIARLNQLRERIESGNIVQVAFVGVCADGGIDYGWETGDRIDVPLVGAVAVLQHAIAKGYVGDE